MPKANRTCYCCGKKYYYCPSCPSDRRDPRIYIMWDSEKCKEIFNVLSNESIQKITTSECKQQLIELGVNQDTVLKENIRKHVDRVMSYENDITEDIVLDTSETLAETKISIKSRKNRTRKSSLKNKENSEVD